MHPPISLTFYPMVAMPFPLATGPVLAILLMAFPAMPSGETLQPKPQPGDNLFDTARVIRLHLDMTAKQFDALSPKQGPGGFGGFGRPKTPPGDAHRNTFGIDLPWSSANLTVSNGEESLQLKDIGIRYKGNYNYIAAANALKKSFKLDMNRQVPGQKLDSLTMLNLHGGLSDPSRARESLSYAFFRAAGVPAPRTCLAELTLTVPDRYNQECVGAYTVVEQVNKPFLRRHFGDGTGMLLKPEGLQGGITYLGDNWSAYQARYQPGDQPSPRDRQRLIDFARLVSKAEDAEFAKDISDYLDTAAFLRFIAANALLANLDSYLGYGHNYYLYLNPATNRFAFIPWDLDLSLATWPAAGMPEQQVNLSLRHPHAGENKLIDRLLAIPAHRDQYRVILRELAAGPFAADKLLAQLEPIEKALVQPLAREAKAVSARKEGQRGGRPGPGGPGFGPPGGMANGQFGQSMPPRRFIRKRAESVEAQLAGKQDGFVPKPLSIGFGPGAPGGANSPGAPRP